MTKMLEAIGLPRPYNIEKQDLLWGEKSGAAVKVGTGRARASHFVALRLHPDAAASRDIANQCFAYLTRLLRAEGAHFSGDDLVSLYGGRTLPIEAGSAKHAQIVSEVLSRIPGFMAASFSIGVEA